jgi:hypothetical protein
VLPGQVQRPILAFPLSDGRQTAHHVHWLYSDLSLSKARAAVKELAAEYFNSQILPRWKHPDILRRRIDKDINPHIDNLKVEDVKPRHIDAMLQNIVARGAPTVANDVLRWTKRIFDYAIKRHAL